MKFSQIHLTFLLLPLFFGQSATVADKAVLLIFPVCGQKASVPNAANIPPEIKKRIDCFQKLSKGEGLLAVECQQAGICGTDSKSIIDRATEKAVKDHNVYRSNVFVLVLTATSPTNLRVEVNKNTASYRGVLDVPVGASISEEDFKEITKYALSLVLGSGTTSNFEDRGCPCFNTKVGRLKNAMELNKNDRFREALEQLEGVRPEDAGCGLDADDYHRAKGIALVGLDRFREAKPLLEKVPSSSDGEVQNALRCCNLGVKNAEWFLQSNDRADEWWNKLPIELKRSLIYTYNHEDTRRDLLEKNKPWNSIKGNSPETATVKQMLNGVVTQVWLNDDFSDMAKLSMLQTMTNLERVYFTKNGKTESVDKILKLPKLIEIDIGLNDKPLVWQELTFFDKSETARSRKVCVYAETTRLNAERLQATKFFNLCRGNF